MAQNNNLDVNSLSEEKLFAVVRDTCQKREQTLYGSSEDPHAYLKLKSWKSDPNYFSDVKCSAVAFMKMMCHAQSGDRLEVMGLLQGKINDKSFIITDVFALPVEGTETRVNAGEEASEFMVNFRITGEQIGKYESIVGWYHTHPGYRCWLSGIDVETQLLHQQHEDPFVAIVIDPIQTSESQKADIKAFRCYERDTRSSLNVSNDSSFSSNRAGDNQFDAFGKHWAKYYELKFSVYRSDLDSYLLNFMIIDRWVNQLSSFNDANELEWNKARIASMSNRMKEANQELIGPGDKVETRVYKKPNKLKSFLLSDSFDLSCDYLRELFLMSINLHAFQSPEEAKNTP